MSSRIRLILHEDYTEVPMWTDVVLIPPRLDDIIVLSLGHFKIFELYHHSPSLPELSPSEYSSGVLMSVRIRPDRFLSRKEQMELCQAVPNTSMWREVPKDERFWEPPPQERPTFEG